MLDVGYNDLTEQTVQAIREQMEPEKALAKLEVLGLDENFLGSRCVCVGEEERVNCRD